MLSAIRRRLGLATWCTQGCSHRLLAHLIVCCSGDFGATGCSNIFTCISGTCTAAVTASVSSSSSTWPASLLGLTVWGWGCIVRHTDVPLLAQARR
mmetsp:Transcript_35857/g.78804  ORF Transcript_35857/g.78804 Transcript_35857/m.78804 type:complete len:96 (+) Transcript_35857:1843-2130(+)